MGPFILEAGTRPLKGRLGMTLHDINHAIFFAVNIYINLPKKCIFLNTYHYFPSNYIPVYILGHPLVGLLCGRAHNTGPPPVVNPSTLHLFVKNLVRLLSGLQISHFKLSMGLSLFQESRLIFTTST